MASQFTDSAHFDSFRSGLAQLVTTWMYRLLGPMGQGRAFGDVTWADLATSLGFIIVTLLAYVVAATFVRRRARALRSQAESGAPPLLHQHVFHALSRPLYALIWICGLDLALTPLLQNGSPSESLRFIGALFDKLFALGVFSVLFWLFFRFTHVLEAHLKSWTSKTDTRLDDLFVPLLGKSLRVIVPVVGIIFALPILELPPESAGVLAKGSSILLIVAVAIIAFQAVHSGENAVVARYDITAADNLQARKVYTQVHVFSKVLYTLILLFATASVLMLFDEVRRLGTSLLASAGVVGVILGFAAQKTIANLFAGFQLAWTQPIRLDDVVIVEGEWGRIEEITLTYVVVHIWDDRRLVVPLSYFIEKPFQNWTRVSAELLGSVFVWVDYSLPLVEIRAALKDIIEKSSLWDRRFWNLQVTDASDKTMQIRVLATSADSSKGWDLRCEIREKLIDYIQQHHPDSLPRFRAQLAQGGTQTGQGGTQTGRGGTQTGQGGAQLAPG